MTDWKNEAEITRKRIQQLEQQKHMTKAFKRRREIETSIRILCIRVADCERKEREGKC